jgi:hypothetical protein
MSWRAEGSGVLSPHLGTPHQQAMYTAPSMSAMGVYGYPGMLLTRLWPSACLHHAQWSCCATATAYGHGVHAGRASQLHREAFVTRST